MKIETCYCRNVHCQFYGQVGPPARLVFRDWHEGAPRLRCTDCDHLVGARTGTAYAGIRTAESIYQSGARHLAEGTSIRATGCLLIPVPPLALPDRKRPSDLERLSQYAAVELFIQRAQAVKPDFAITNETVPAVAEICFQRNYGRTAR